MRVGVVVEGIHDRELNRQPWIHHRGELQAAGIEIEVLAGESDFMRPFDAMLLYVWQDWRNPRRFELRRIWPMMERYAVYRARFPDTVQIVLNHTDMVQPPHATPFWRSGDPVLYRTPPYDRSQAAPFPPASIWPYEMVWGRASFSSGDAAARYKAGFIGRTSGPRGYRERVAAATAQVGIGLCGAEKTYEQAEHDALMAQCAIVVCPRGWGENSARHWDAWLSGKPVLTDRACASAEMIPGVRLHAGEHYLVFDEPEEIPDIVNEWSSPRRADELAAIAANGQRAVRTYDAYANIKRFFESAVPNRGR